MSEYKIVSMPIVVPKGGYCWEATMQGAICEFFDNLGGHATCKLGFQVKVDKETGVVTKGDICKRLR